MPPYFMGIENPEDIYLNTVVVPKPVCDSEPMTEGRVAEKLPGTNPFYKGL